MGRQAKIDVLRAQIAADLDVILAIHDDAQHADNGYLTQQIQAFLPKPLMVAGDLKKLRDLFLGAVAPQPAWHYSGLEYGGSFKMFLAFAHSPRGGKNKDQIRLSPKAFLLKDATLAGVMLHEATHFLLSTVDHVYDMNFLISDDHAKLLRLSNQEKYENADNWRIFYQRMRKKVRPAAT
jgi:hypothetical protein